MEQDGLVTLSVERLKGTYGRITVAWEADGSVSDIFPTSGVVCYLQTYRIHGTNSCLMDEVFEFAHVNTGYLVITVERDTV